MNKYVSILAAAAFAVSLGACKDGGIVSETSETTVTNVPSVHDNLSPSVKVLDVRVVENTTAGVVLDIDIYPMNQYGDLVLNLKKDQIGVFGNSGLVSQELITATPLTPVSDVTAGNYSLTVVVDKSASMVNNDEFDLRVDAIRALSDGLVDNEIQLISAQGSDPLTQYVDLTGGFVSSIDSTILDGLVSSDSGISIPYDGIIHGLGADGVLNGTNNKALMLITDGVNDSATTAEDAIALATSEGWNVPVFILSTNAGDASLELLNLATETGGIYSSLVDREQAASIANQMTEVLSALGSSVNTSYSLLYTIRVAIIHQAGGTAHGDILVDFGHDTIAVPFSVAL